MNFATRTLGELTVDDEASFRHVELFARLQGALRRDAYPFRVLPRSQEGRWDRALCLNLTFWGSDGGGDVLVDEHIPADVVAHVAWHHLASRAFRIEAGAQQTPEAMFLGEAVASAFDVYLVGRLLGHAPDSQFLETQVPAMADAAAEAGASDEQFEAMLTRLAKDPEAAFEDLRALLFDVSKKLFACVSAEDALAVFEAADAHKLAMLLHRFELSNWVLYARAYGARGAEVDARVTAVDEGLRQGGLVWLAETWLPA